MATTTLSIRIPSETRAQLDRLAEATGRTCSFLAAEALSTYLEREAWQVAEINVALVEADAGDFATDAEVRRTVARWCDPPPTP